MITDSSQYLPDYHHQKPPPGGFSYASKQDVYLIDLSFCLMSHVKITSLKRLQQRKNT
jgi:hypothetical protein